MASIRRRGATWQVQVRRQGLRPLVRTFRLKADAELWARQREAEIDRGDLPTDHRTLRSLTLSSLLGRYRDTVTPKKRGAAQEHYKLRILLAHSIAGQSLEKLSASDIAAYRDERLSMVAAGTVRRELAVLQHCFEIARSEWGVALPENPVRKIKMPSRAVAGSGVLHRRSLRPCWEAVDKADLNGFQPSFKWPWRPECAGASYYRCVGRM